MPCSSFFFHDTATTEIYTLSLHDALPISYRREPGAIALVHTFVPPPLRARGRHECVRSEEHTSELQSHSDLVCRLLLEKKKATAAAAPLDGRPPRRPPPPSARQRTTRTRL